MRLGGRQACTGAERIVTHFETRRITALLAYLALHLRRPVPREVLAERLWPDEDWDATRNRLRQALSSLRHDLEPGGAEGPSVLITDRSDVSLDSAVIATDVGEFDAALCAVAKLQDPTERAAILRTATGLYRGELLPGYYEDWVVAERGRLAEAYRSALDLLAEAMAETGDYAAAIEMGRRCIAEDPLREDAHCRLMRSYAAAGRTSEAIRQYRELERCLREEVGATPSAATRALLDRLRSDLSPSAAPAPWEATAVRPAAAVSGEHQAPPPSQLEAEGGAVALGSAFYVARATDEEFHIALARGDSIVLVKGPRQIGKTSLLARGLQQGRAAGANVILTDLQKLAPEQLESPAALFRAFAELISGQLDLDGALDEHWNPRRGWNVNFERFLRREVLASRDAAPASPVIWAIDEVDRLFACSFSSTAFGLFRSWHNERSLDPEGPWGRLTLAIAYATEAHLFITDLNQSPFNVGTRLALQDFGAQEVAEMNRRYGTPLHDPHEVARYFALVGGHPYLVRRGLHALAEGSVDLAALEEETAEEDGVFNDHLRRMLASLSQDPTLCAAVSAVLQGRPCPAPESFYRLRSAGVLAGASSQDARPRCGLYRLYLASHLL